MEAATTYTSHDGKSLSKRINTGSPASRHVQPLAAGEDAAQASRPPRLRVQRPGSQDAGGTTLVAYPKDTSGALTDGDAEYEQSDQQHRRAMSESLGNRPQILLPSSISSPRPGFKSFFTKAGLSRKGSLSSDQRGLVSLPRDLERTPGEGILPLPEGSQAERYEVVDEIKVPALLQQGTPMLKMSAKQGPKLRKFRLDADQGHVLWESKKGGLIRIENIREMRTGANARNYREAFKIAADAESRWLTIIHACDGKYKAIHIVAFSVDVFHMWNTTLQKLHSLRKELMSGLGNMEQRQLVWERQYWKGADVHGSSRLDFNEVENMCRRLNISPARADLLEKFQNADSDHDGFLDFSDFQRFVTLLKIRSEIHRLYKECSRDGVMMYTDFEYLMRHTQKCTLDAFQLQQLFEKYSELPATIGSPQQDNGNSMPTTAGASSPAHESALTLSPAGSSDGSRSTMTPDGLASFLMSPDNAAFSDHSGRIDQDMTRPIYEYFISSSHNTYLVGNQVVGESTCEGYIRVLLQGCRSVEIDVWDGDTEPCVYHGRTLTSKVSAREVSRAIMKYAFIASPYPIIISAEIHCKVEQQDMLAQIFKQEFGDALVTAPLPGREHEVDKMLPSPEDLKGRILLKTKNLFITRESPIEDDYVNVNADTSWNSETSGTSDAEVSSSASTSGPGALQRARDLVGKVRKKGSAALLPRPRSGSQHRENVGGTPHTPASPANLKTKLKMSTELAELLVYSVGVKCRGLNKKEVYEPAHMFSLSETAAGKIMKASMMELIKHNRAHVIRVYPKGTRLNSSNYEPHRYWASGAQLVALNWQTCDLGYMINYAMFQRNGACGFVMKPEALRIRDKQALRTLTRHYLDVTIISAQQLPRPKDGEGREVLSKSVINPFVEVTLHVPEWWASMESAATTANEEPLSSGPRQSPGKTRDSFSGSATRISRRTNIVKNNGFNPLWEEEMSIPFHLVGVMKDLVFVRFEVRDKSDAGEEHAVGVYCVSLGSLMMGYRHLPLHDQQMSQYLFSTLFVKLRVRDA